MMFEVARHMKKHKVLLRVIERRKHALTLVYTKVIYLNFFINS